MNRVAAYASLLFVLAAASCRSAKQVPESGAVLLQLRLETGAPAPDELRLWVYDNSGTLWSDVRFPAEGALAPPQGTDLGTILIQPGAVSGRLRIHGRAFAAGLRVLDGTVAMTAGADATAELDLGAAVPADGDGDGVPDDIDDCAAAPNPDQGGCAISGAGGTGGTGGSAGGTEDSDGGTDDAAADAAQDDGGACDGACGRPAGATCGLDADCVSGFCADGVCCETACLGACRSCNQPNADGVCQPYLLGTDPERECGTATCNGAGACGAPPPPTDKPNGSVCSRTVECASDFCTDGVCCPEACTNPCFSCKTGACLPVTNHTDAPQCATPMTCNAKGKCVGGG